MRCPYCNGVNNDRSVYCTYCGRNMTVPPPPNAGAPRQQSSRPTIPTAPPQRGQPQPQSPPQPPQQPVQRPPAQPVVHSGQPTRAKIQAAPVAAQQTGFYPASVTPPVPSAPEPPAPFPPRTIANLQALEKGALEYKVVDSTIGNGRKKVVRIAYAHCVPWQQVATLFKALKEQQEAKFEGIVVQGVYPQDSSVYSFTNGQLQLDRNVLLGGSVMDRYQIETGTGLESDAQRIVLYEE